MKKAPGADLGQAMPKITEDESTEPNEHETKMHLNDLMRAHEIMNDSNKMKAVHKLAGRHAKAIKSIKDLKDLYQEKYGAGGSATAVIVPNTTSPEAKKVKRGQTLKQLKGVNTEADGPAQDESKGQGKREGEMKGV